MNTTKFRLSEPLSFIGVTYRNMGEVTYKRRNDFNSCTSKPTPSMGDSSRSWEPGAHRMASGQNQQVWRVPFSVAGVGLVLFQQT